MHALKTSIFLILSHHTTECSESSCLRHFRAVISFAAASLILLGVNICIDSDFLRDELFERCTIPTILDMVLAPGGVEYLYTDFHPSFSVLLVPLPQQQIVFSAERKVIDGRIQVIHPSITYLLPCASWQLWSKVCPLSKRR